MKLLKYLLIALITSIALQCMGMGPSETSSTGGTGSEVVGVVKYPDSSQAAKKMKILTGSHPMKFAGVYIRPKSYLADTGSVKDVTNIFTAADGSFRISRVLPGEHLVYIDDGAGMAIASVVTVPEDSTTINLDTLTAKKTASVQVQYDGVTPGKVLFYVTLRGAGISVRCTERNIFAALENIPTGADVSHKVTIRMYSPFVKGFDVDIPVLDPDQIFTLESLKDL
ncbi:MAG TPA: hypothetical protein VHO70_24985 [Chitinispirillaceae bacterium]|nr:hypothetical protein [Chitinispirillaceae bacterium]